MWSQDGGTLPAPLFLFLAGMSFALVTSKLLERRLTPRQIARIMILRGAEIFGAGVSCSGCRNLLWPGDGRPGAICCGWTF